MLIVRKKGEVGEMNKIYKDFQDLVKENQHFFNVLGDKDKYGFYQAIWESRELEIEALKQSYNSLREEFDSLNESIALYQDESLIFDEEKNRFLVEMAQKKDVIKKLQIEIKSLHKKCQSLEISSSHKTIQSLEESKKKILGQIDHIRKEKKAYSEYVKNLQDNNKQLYREIEIQKTALDQIRSLYIKETTVLHKKIIKSEEEKELLRKRNKQLQTTSTLLEEKHTQIVEEKTTLKEKNHRAGEELSLWEQKHRAALLEITKLKIALEEERKTKRKKDSYIRSLEFVQKNLDTQREQLFQRNNDLEKTGEQMHTELHYQRELVSSLANKIDRQDAEIDELNSRLNKAKKRSKQYTHINNRMSEEMEQMGRKVSALRMAIN